MPAATTLAEAFADTVSALVGEPDVTDVLAHLVADCASVTGAESVAILARDSTGELSLLAATSHRVTELEILQIQRSNGPCVDVIETNEALAVSGVTEIIARWHRVGQAIVDAGYDSVQAFPLRWRGTVLGGLNLFGTRAGETAADAQIAQAFADIATLAVIYSMPISAEQAATRLHEALNARELVEQAKGVISYVENVDMGTAYEILIRRAETTGDTLTHTATTILEEQQRRPETG
jgi:hypothetical protein